MLVACIAYLLPWRWRQYVPPKSRKTLNSLHDVTYQSLLWKPKVWQSSFCCLLLWLILRPWRWRNTFLEMLVTFYRTTRPYIPEYGTLHSHPCNNLQSNRVRTVCAHWINVWCQVISWSILIHCSIGHNEEIQSGSKPGNQLDMHWWAWRNAPFRANTNQCGVPDRFLIRRTRTSCINLTFLFLQLHINIQGENNDLVVFTGCMKCIFTSPVQCFLNVFLLMLSSYIHSNTN
jgi:hypothetical protein